MDGVRSLRKSACIVFLVFGVVVLFFLKLNLT